MFQPIPFSKRQNLPTKRKKPALTWGSQWGGGFYGYRLKFCLFYGYRFFFQLRLTKKLKINFFCFKKLNTN